jgi:uncharacterized spore protein YtfJ
VDIDQPSFTDIEYGNRRRVSRREKFLEAMDATIPWASWVAVIEPFYYADRAGKRGRKAKPVETMLRMYLLQVWFSLSDEGVEDAVYDSYAMRRFMGLDFAVEQVPDATTLLHFRHLLEEHQLGEKLLAAQNEVFAQQGWIMRGGSIIDATIIAAPSSTKNATGTRDPAMHQTKKGNQWFFGMKAHIGADAGTGYVHTVTATAANVHDLDEAVHLVRADDDILTRVGDQLGIRRVFGEPIDRDGVTVVPVAVSIGGGGGGNAPEDQGSGGGFGGMVRGIGAYSISNGQVRFVPAVDTTALAAMFVLVVGVVVRARRRRGA